MKSYLKYLFFTTFILLLIGCGGGTTTTDEINGSEQQNTTQAALVSENNASANIQTPVTPTSALVSDPVYGTVTLSWQAPTTYTDGSDLTDLAGYYIYYGKVDDYGKDNGVAIDVIDIQDATATTHTFTKLKSSDYFFAISAYSQAGVESVKSAPTLATNN